MRGILVVVFALFVAVIFTGCGGGSAYLQDGKLKQTIEQTNQTDKYMEAIGLGAAIKDSTDSTQRKASSRNAAIVAAEYDFVKRIKGVKIEGGVTIEKAMETDSKIKATVDDCIKGAEVVKTEWDNNDGCVVTMRIDKELLQKNLGVKFEK
ncbi:MAG: hypothetical protein ABH873_00155 [Candidatus Firestonebacteria bacterium]